MRVTRGMLTFLSLIIFSVALYISVFGFVLPESEIVNHGQIALLCIGLAVVLGVLIPKHYDRDGQESVDSVFWITYTCASSIVILIVVNIVSAVLGMIMVSFWMSSAVVCISTFFILWRARK
jgi:hypothetical protein